MSEVVVTPEITKPLETVGAPFAILFVMMLVLSLDIHYQGLGNAVFTLEIPTNHSPVFASDPNLPALISR